MIEKILIHLSAKSRALVNFWGGNPGNGHGASGSFSRHLESKSLLLGQFATASDCTPFLESKSLLLGQFAIASDCTPFLESKSLLLGQ